MGVTVWFETLGTLTAYPDDDGSPEALVISRRKARTVLAVLLCTPRAAVSLDSLVDALWPEHPPDAAVGNLRVYVHELRDALGADRIASTGHGYRACVRDDELDTTRFGTLQRQAERAEAAGDPGQAATLLRAALALWRGDPFTGCDPSPALTAQAQRWREQRLQTLADCVEMELAAGQDRALVPELTDLVAQHPLAEQFRAQLMLALHRCGRTDDALHAFTAGRDRAIGETGLEPGPRLCELQRAILRADPALKPVADSRRPPAVPSPAQLPTDIADFTGRDAHLAQLGDLLGRSEAGEHRPAITVIAGPGGVGKTALAVHAGHRHRGSFADGQLHVNLRGTDTAAAEPAVVLGRFLRALGVDGAAIPDDMTERVHIYRSIVAGKRLLVVLDNAADEAQVRPLIPGGPRCGVLVTSRARLPALEGAVRLDLDVLDTGRAVELLARLAGADRVAAEPRAAETVAALCGHLPLAVRIAGARLGTRPDWPLSRLADRLADERRRLDELETGDLQVRGSIALSYTALTPAARRALRLLGVADLPDFAPWVPVPLLAADPDAADRLVDELVQAQLLTATGADATGQPRYRMHDLVRVYARERAGADDPPAEQHAALARLVAAWLALAERGAHVLSSGVPRPRPGTATRWDLGPELTAALLSDPLAWFAVEAPSLVAAVDRAAWLGLDEAAWELFVALISGRFLLGSQFEEWAQAHRAARTATRRAGNLRGEAILECGTGLLCFRQDRFADAAGHFHHALTVCQAIGSDHDEAIARCGLAITAAHRGDHAELAGAARHAQRARAIFEAHSDARAAACAAAYLGAVRNGIGPEEDSLTPLNQAMEAYRRFDDQRGQAACAAWIGYAHRIRGEHAVAIDWWERARQRFRRLGDRVGEAEVAHDLARVLVQQGKWEQAQATLTHCLTAYEEIGRPASAARVLSTLGELHLATGKLDEAADALGRAQDIWATRDVPLWHARTLLLLGDLHAARDEPEDARRAWCEARRLFTELGDPQARRATDRLG